MTAGETIKIIARKEIKYLLREKTFFLLLAVFIIMAALSTFIGWSAQHTIRNVYDAATAELAANHQAIPAFPLAHVSSLAIIKNMIIYVVLIGSLVSIILGYFIGINDRISGTIKLIFSRQVSKTELLGGKIFAITYVLSIITLSALAISLISAGIFHVLSFANGLKILGFYALSFLYMLGFALLSLALAMKMKSSAGAILYSLFIWIIITFALPELSSALYPTSLLNPVLPPTDILNSPVLSYIHNFVWPFSISEHFKELSAAVLGVADLPGGQPSLYAYGFNISIIFFWNIFSFLAAFLFFRKIKPAQSDLYE